MNNQEIFNKVWNHFVVNKGKPGFDYANICCTYGSPGDINRCAIGIFDEKGILEKYNTRDGIPLCEMVVDDVIEIFGENADFNFLGMIQEIHDDCATDVPYRDIDSNHKLFVEGMKNCLTNFARDNQLLIPN